MHQLLISHHPFGVSSTNIDCHPNKPNGTPLFPVNDLTPHVV